MNNDIIKNSIHLLLHNSMATLIEHHEDNKEIISMLATIEDILEISDMKLNEKEINETIDFINNFPTRSKLTMMSVPVQ